MSATEVTFVQTAGGRTGVPAPRRVCRPPFVQISAPLAWTTLSLTIRADGTVTHQMTGASPFPRHWVYDTDGKLLSKSGVIDFSSWYRRAFGKHSPWGDRDSPALTTEVESALERQLSIELMQGSAKPTIRDVKKGTAITDPGRDRPRAVPGPRRRGPDRGRRQGGWPSTARGRCTASGPSSRAASRTSTIRAVTDCKLAVATADEIDRDALTELSSGHRREEQD